MKARELEMHNSIEMVDRFMMAMMVGCTATDEKNEIFVL